MDTYYYFSDDSVGIWVTGMCGGYNCVGYLEYNGQELENIGSRKLQGNLGVEPFGISGFSLNLDYSVGSGIFLRRAAFFFAFFMALSTSFRSLVFFIFWGKT